MSTTSNEGEGRGRARGGIPLELRNTIIFVAALALLIHEAVIKTKADPILVGAFLMMLGFPIVSQADAVRSRVLGGASETPAVGPPADSEPDPAGSEPPP